MAADGIEKEQKQDGALTGKNLKVFLVGFMGCGKTYWGQQLSTKLSLPFFDLDALIEEQEKKIIHEIFNAQGEEHFRLLEKDVLHLVSESHDAFIMATGGGTPCYFNNMGYMKKCGTVLWLNCSTDTIYSRLSEDTGKRPLIKDLSDNQLQSYIIKKLSDRRIYYEQATASINKDNVELNEIVSKIFHN